MKTLVWLVVLAALAAGISVAAIYNDGYALLVLPPWRVELSLNLLLILVVAFFVLLYFVMRAAGALLTLPSSVREYRARRARDTADVALREAMTMLLEGRFSRALRAAEAAFNAGHAPLLAALLAQRAAHGMRDREREAFWRARAREHDRNDSPARLMVEAGIATEYRDFDTARALLDHMARTGGRHVEAQRLALRVHQGLGNWREVERIVRQLEKHHALTAEQSRPVRQRAQRELLAQIGQRNDGGNGIEQFLRELPEADRLEPRLVLDASRRLNAAGRHAEAATLIEDALELAWDSDLAAAYGDCGGDVLARIAHAERWLLDHPRDAKLLLTLGRLCRRRQLWGKAQSYLEASLSTEVSRDAQLALAALHDQLGQHDLANRYYRAVATEL